ncbi:ribosomal protein S18-alanine N-acetyltransferase [Vagococcus sp. CY53-2]|uniref:ribosomal protein S18-alanine N-acetyltransferase n=1 Tax=Vagococcus sp. CY53-2 TaxID=2925780 RepID=UPI001F512783|nr:ribosomal protein S18-alanine N-acetyltransferase [Vagococcus sp. CY53-2]MCI0129970.1 ribosomal protein S18-alanine N-acetyltransferase [Vagococcus sp. CY53-2]
MNNKNLARQLKKVSDTIFEHGSPWTESQFESQLMQANTEIIYHCEDDEMIGYIICQRVLDEAELLLIGVIPSYKHRGIATQLLKDMCQRLKQKKVSHFCLEVRVKNIEAISFYDKHGFKELGIRKNYYKHPSDDAKIMQLEI